MRYVVGMLMLSVVTASADDVVWKSEVKTSQFDCRQGGADRIVIAGVVNLVHPDDADLRKPAKYITVTCPNLRFEPSSKLTSDSSLDIRIEGIVSGPVFIESTRGKKGEDAPPTPERWQPSAAADGVAGAAGAKGEDAAKCWMFGHGPDAGRDGQKGGRGSDGRIGDVGADGLAGMNGSNIRLIAGAFDKEVTIEVNSVGGDGGSGGAGGRGQDGGAGGSGGPGGAAGEDWGCHLTARGGNGGPGGDGGNGGIGGQGGQGGSGGRGGNIGIGVKGGDPPGIPKYNADGGAGGFGGLGGQPGAGGKSGEPGRGGEGTPIPFLAHDAIRDDGSDGPNGVDGKIGEGSRTGFGGDTGMLGATAFGPFPSFDGTK